MSERPPSFTRQAGPDVRLGWGRRGLAAVGPGCKAIVAVDVLSFATAADVALGNGVSVIPCRWRDARAAEIAREHDALLAGPRGSAVSLSPVALAALAPRTRIVLPSPNGSHLATEAVALGAQVYVACLRNASAVARAVAALPPPIAVIAGGERWPDGALRVALEDLLGAGAVIAALPGSRSPEAAAAAATYAASRENIADAIRDCASGRELREQGFGEDVRLAGQVDVSTTVPRLVDGVLIDDASR